MKTITQVKELTPDYRIRMAGNAVRNDDVVWRYQRMMVGGIIRKRLSWDEVQTMRNQVERLRGCNRVWDTETYEASHVKVLLRTLLCKNRSRTAPVRNCMIPSGIWLSALRPLYAV